MNKKPEITSVCCTLYICKNFQLYRKHFVDISHIQLFWFPLNIFCKQNINLTEGFHVKSPRLAFSFLPPVNFEIFTAGFSSRIFIFRPVHRLQKSDYSRLCWLQLYNVTFEYPHISIRKQIFPCFYQAKSIYYIDCKKSYSSSKTITMLKSYLQSNKYT